MVFDIGSGAVRQLTIRGIDIREVEVLSLSHFHPDHVADLVPWLFALRNPEFGHHSKLTLVGPRGTRNYLSSLEEIYGDWIRPPSLTLSLVESFCDVFDYGSWSLKTAATGHTSNSLAFRVEERGGPALVYGGDSPFSDKLTDLARGADLLVLECSFPDNHPGAEGHLTPSQAGVLAARAGVKRLLLTHFYPAVDSVDRLAPARSRFDGEIIIASDGLEISF